MKRLTLLVVGVVLFGKFARRYRPKCYDNDGYRWWVISRWPFKGYLHGHLYVSGHDGSRDSLSGPYHRNDWHSVFNRKETQFSVTDSEGRDRGHFPANWLDKKPKQ